MIIKRPLHHHINTHTALLLLTVIISHGGYVASSVHPPCSIPLRNPCDHLKTLANTICHLQKKSQPSSLTMGKSIPTPPGRWGSNMACPSRSNSASISDSRCNMDVKLSNMMLNRSTDLECVRPGLLVMMLPELSFVSQPTNP